tara:strand:+ start:484 stop:651 length:168 start_codon:yes stop_codon:yes gene_type:complete
MQVTIEIPDATAHRLHHVAEARQELVDYTLSVALRRGLDVMEEELAPPGDGAGSG